MSKIIVIGSPGAGKSVFSQKLSNITNLPLYHMDMLYHKKDGTHISKEELENKIHAAEAYHTQYRGGLSKLSGDSIRGTAIFRGYQIREKYAEAFRILRLGD